MRALRFDASQVAPLLAALVTLGAGGAALPYTVDDAYVIARYARRLARGLGWSADPGPPTDGVTGPLAVVPGLLAERVGIDPVLAAKLLGLVCGALAAALVTRAAGRHALGGPSALLVAVLTSCNATLPIWCQAGLETGMATLAATLASLAAVARPRPRGGVLGGALAALAWLRPECALLGAGLLGACALRDRRQALWAMLLAGSGAASVVAFRILTFGDPVPLAWSAKPAEVLRGLGYTARGLAIVAGIGGLGLLADAARRSRPLRLLGLALAAHASAVVLAGGDWMPGFRLFAPVVPSYALAAGIGAARAIALTRGRRRWVAMVLVTAAIGIPAADLFVQVPRAREAGETQVRVGIPLARAIAALAGPRPVALVDVGLLPWFGGFRTLDLGGITDPTIGRRPGRHLAKRVDPELLFERDVGVIVLRAFEPPRVAPSGDLDALAGEPVERALAAAEAVRRAFRVARVVRWSDHYFYVVLVREGAQGAWMFSPISGSIAACGRISRPDFWWRCRRSAIRTSRARSCWSSSTARTGRWASS